MPGAGTSKQDQTSQQQTRQIVEPWGPAGPGLNSLAKNVSGMIPAGLTGAQSGALDTLQTNANAGNPYAPQIGVIANDLLGGGQDRTGYATGSYDAYKASLDPIARGDFVDPSKNPALQGYLSTIGNDISSRVNGMFAGAGRDFSGANMNALSRGLTEGMAPTLLNAYQGERGNQLSAIDKLYGAGGNTAGILSGLDQTKLGNQQAGIGVAGQALDAKDSAANQTLAIEAKRLGIPLEQYAQIMGILGPLGGMGGTSSGSSSGQMQGSSTMSPIQQFAMAAGGLGAMFKPSDRRLKDDITQVGALYDGTPVYRFRYKSGDTRMTIGLMADDIEKFAPESVIEINGYKAVDYTKATERAAEMGAQ